MNAAFDILIRTVVPLSVSVTEKEKLKEFDHADRGFLRDLGTDFIISTFGIEMKYHRIDLGIHAAERSRRHDCIAGIDIGCSNIIEFEATQIQIVRSL